MNKDTEQQIKQLQIFEQNLQGYLSQKQQLQTQIIEITSALNEIKNKDEGYKIIGNIMIKKTSEELTKDLENKKELINLKMKSLEKQENIIKEKSKKIQEEIMQNMGNKNE